MNYFINNLLIFLQVFTRASWFIYLVTGKYYITSLSFGRWFWYQCWCRLLWGWCSIFESIHLDNLKMCMVLKFEGRIREDENEEEKDACMNNIIPRLGRLLLDHPIQYVLHASHLLGPQFVLHHLLVLCSFPCLLKHIIEHQ